MTTVFADITMTLDGFIPIAMDGGTSFTFVTDGIESALAQAKSAAGDKDVQMSSGANIIQQCINAGRLDEIQVHISPVMLGAGTRLFDGIDAARLKFDPVRVIESPNVTHIRYRFVRQERIRNASGCGRTIDLARRLQRRRQPKPRQPNG